LTLTADYSGQPFVPMPWQEQILRDLFGTFDEDGLRTYRDVYLEVPKKNSKTTFCAGLVLYFLSSTGTTGTEVYSAATARDQAGILFRAAQQMVLNSPSMSARFECIPSGKRIVKRVDPTSFYAAISADGDVHDGIQPALVVRDELHRWRTRKALELNEILERGMITRRQMMAIDITTAGEVDESPLCWRRHEYAQQIQKGVFEDRRFYGRIWAADLQQHAWDTVEARVQANPSHEANGGYLKDSVLADMLVKAQNDPAAAAEYKRYHLNIWGQRDEAAIDLDKWIACGGGVDLREWPEYDVELLISKWGLAEKPCAIGVDAAWTIDLASMVCIFPPEEDEIWRLVAFYWIPSERAKEKERRDKVPYRDWVRRGFIQESPGEANDMRDIAAKVKWAVEMFDVSHVAFDPWNFRATANELAEEGVPMIDISQNFGKLSAPTKLLLGLYLDGKLAHGNNPVLNWNASCLALQADRKDNVQPTKPDRGKSGKRIDGISAIVTGLAPMEGTRKADPAVFFL
jgi:phage terminase large subunit-like protein